MVSTQELRTYLKIDGTSDDSFLQVSLDSSVASVENYCNRKLTYGEYIQYSNGNGKDELFVTNYPLISVTSIEVFNGFDSWNNLFLTSDSDSLPLFIIPELNKIKLTQGFYFSKGQNNIKISYTSGFADSTNGATVGQIYNDIKSVILEMSAHFYNNSSYSGKASLGIHSLNVNSAVSESVVFLDLTPQWKNRLKKYRITFY